MTIPQTTLSSFQVRNIAGTYNAVVGAIEVDGVILQDYSTGQGNDSLVDTPTNYGTDTGAGGEVRGNYATWNPLLKGGGITLSNGNLNVVSASSGGRSTISTIAFDVGADNFYCELTVNSSGSTFGIIGIENPDVANYIGYSALGYAYSTNGSKYNSNSGSAYGASYTAGDIIGMPIGS